MAFISKSDTGDPTGVSYTLLRSQLALLMGFICIFYLLFDLFKEIYIFLPWQLGGIAFALVILYLNRIGRSNLASVLLLLVLNLLIFAFAASDSPSRGVYFYFITSSTFSLILFYPQSKVLASLFIIFPVTLAILAVTKSVVVFAAPQATAELLDIYFILNFLLASSGTALIIIFAIKKYYNSNKLLTIKKEELALKNFELEKSNYELDRFVYSASHDMKAPLSTISGLIMLVNNSKTLEEANEYIALMNGRVKALSGFIGDITDYSRNMRLEPEIEEINIRKVCEEIIDSYDFLAKKSEVSVRLNIDKDKVQTDKLRVAVIIGNLLSNSIKYHNPSVGNRSVNITINNSDGELIIQVDDNGVGIPDEYKDRVFDMFFRASDNSDGSGLGLYIVNETVNRLGGKISFISDQSRGTTFTVNLPSNNGQYKDTMETSQV